MATTPQRVRRTEKAQKSRRAGAAPPEAAHRVDAGLGAPTLLETEWLLTDGHGGFAMGTAIGASVRRYHGLLIAATKPPVGRFMALNNLVDRVTIDPGTQAERHYDLSTHCFGAADGGVLLHPDGWKRLSSFEKHADRVVWRYDFDGVSVARELALAPQPGGATVRYTIDAGGRPARLIVLPLVSMRGFHGMLRYAGSDLHSISEPMEAAGCAVHLEAHAQRLKLSCDPGRFARQPDWWHRFEFRRDRERGQDHEEDLFTPGRFVFDIPAGGPGECALHASLTPSTAGGPSPAPAREARTARVGRAVEKMLDATPGLERAPELVSLVQAADDFVVRRSVDGRASTTIIAGYPWFSDWGRDTLICIPGLLLSTRRFDEAMQALDTFARHVRRGLVPNVFDDDTGQPHYNTVDASMWFLHAACEYERSTGDRDGFDERLKPACLDIVEHYLAGTDFGIGVDPADGLVAAGDAGTQLTWMDAKRDGVVFTPRHGKAVEINALWIHGLRSLARLLEGGAGRRAADLCEAADSAAASFNRLFWNAEGGWLFDCLSPGSGASWAPSRDFRPNQIFAASLAHGPLDLARRRAVVDCVGERLLTPFGLRTLAPDDPKYVGRLSGDLFARDQAYHNGAVWPWLIGPYVEALLRARDFNDAARAEARRALLPLLDSLSTGCLGQIAEIYDGDGTPDEPQRQSGCPAQAWSVAETLRALTLVEGAAPL